MNYEIKTYQDYHQAEILPLYESVGWTNYVNRADRLEKAFQNALLILAAYDGDKIVGLVRTVGDGVSIVFIQDLLVLPTYQRQGIGTALMQSVFEKYKDVYQIELLTDDTEKSRSFYESLNMKTADELDCVAYVRM
jgi:GNAT superfamily N-acetyltransferase